MKKENRRINGAKLVLPPTKGAGAGRQHYLSDNFEVVHWLFNSMDKNGNIIYSRQTVLTVLGTEYGAGTGALSVRLSDNVKMASDHDCICHLSTAQILQWVKAARMGSFAAGKRQAKRELTNWVLGDVPLVSGSSQEAP